MSGRLLALAALAAAAAGCSEQGLIGPEVAPVHPCLRLDPESVDFGEVRVLGEATVTRLVTLENRCGDDVDGTLTGDLTLGEVSLADPTADDIRVPDVRPTGG